MNPVRRIWPVYAALAAIAIFALYAHTLHFGFYWDDFDDLRPWTWADLGRAFVGHYQPWAREGIYFYRPLTSVYLASATTLFGLNAVALHVIPLCTLTIAATLSGVFVERETGSRAAGMTGTLLYAVHPLTASAIGPWIANQYQGLLVIAVLSALLIWRETATTGFRLTPGLVIAIIAAAWLKEDGLMLGPALLAVQSARAWISGDVPRPSSRTVTAVLGLAAGLIAWRWLWLPSQFGYGMLDAPAMLVNLTRAWRYALVWHTGPAPLAAVLTLVTSLLLGAVLWILVSRRRDANTRVAITGLALMAVMNLPLAFVSSENRWHVMGLCAVFITTAAISVVRSPMRWVALLLTTTLFAASAWERMSIFAPCSADNLSHTAWAMTLPELPAELHQWLATRGDVCRAGRPDRFDEFSIPMRDLRWGHR